MIKFTSLERFLFAFAAFALPQGWALAQTTYQYSTITPASRWLNSGNWTGNHGHFPGVDFNPYNAADGALDDIATFGVLAFSGASIGIDMGNSTQTGLGNNTAAGGDLALGAIQFRSDLAKALIFGNVSASPGYLDLDGGTLNGTANTILSNESTQNVTIQNGVVAGAGYLSVNLYHTTNVIQINNTGNITISSDIVGNSNLTFQTTGNTPGSLTLSGSNTYSTSFNGTFTASGGTTYLGAPGSADHALARVSAVSIASGASVIAATTGFTDTINDSAAVTVNGTLNLTGGTETVGSLSGTSAGAALKIGSISTTADGAFTVGDANNTSFAGVISGSRLAANAGGILFTRQGSGVLTLTNANTFTDVMAIMAGGITITNSSALGAVGANNGTTVAGGAVLALDGTNGALAVGTKLLTINGAGLTSSPAGALRNIAGDNSWSGAITVGSASTITSTAGTLTLTGGITNGGNLVTFDGAGNTTVSTTGITGAGGLTKKGTGVVTLSSLNSYGGATQVNGGTLLVNGSIPSGSSVSVSNTGTVLGGTGTISGAVTLTGSSYSPGAAASIGTLTSGALSLTSTSTFVLDIDTTSPSMATGSDRAVANGNFSLDSAENTILAITDRAATSQTLAPGDFFRFVTYTGTWNNGLFTYNGNVLQNGDQLTVGNNIYQISYNTGLGSGTSAAQIIVVPEPATYVLFGIGLLIWVRAFRPRSVHS